MLGAGEYNQRVTILEPVESDQLVGEKLVDYRAAKSVWARVRPLSGKTTAQFKQSQILAEAEITVRFVDWLTKQHRICFRGDSYSIQNMQDFENRHEDWTLTCTKVKAK